MWPYQKSKYDVRLWSLLTFLDEPDCILGSCFLVLLYEWSLYIHTHTRASDYLSYKMGKTFWEIGHSFPGRAYSNMSLRVPLTFHLQYGGLGRHLRLHDPSRLMVPSPQRRWHQQERSKGNWLYYSMAGIWSGTVATS